MRAVLVASGVLLVILIAAAHDRPHADCQGGPIFAETIVAIDKNTFAWTSPLDVDYAKGDVAAL